MKIAYLSISMLPSRFANAVQVMKMCHAFALTGHEVVLYAVAGGGDLADLWNRYGVESRFTIRRLRLLAPERLGQWLYALRAALSADVQSADWVYGRHLLSIWASAALGKAVCLEVHGLPETAFRRCLLRMLIRSPRLGGVVCITESLKSAYLELFPDLAKRRVVVAQDAAEDPGTGSPIESCMFALCPGKSGLRIGYVGHLYPGKGIEQIVRIAAVMTDEVFHVVGGLPEDLARWEAEAPANVCFHGYVEHGKLDSYYRALDVALAPLQREVWVQGRVNIGKFTSPLKIFEYMSYGKAIICSDLPVLREVLEPNKTAVLCDPVDTSQWVGAIKRLAGSQELRTRLGTCARMRFLERHTWAARAASVCSMAGVPDQ